MSVKLLTEHHLEFLSLKGGCTVSSESTLVKIPHCWKSHVAAQIRLDYIVFPTQPNFGRRSVSKITITISDNMDCGLHISEISSIATKARGFLRRNLAFAPKCTKNLGPV